MVKGYTQTLEQVLGSVLVLTILITLFTPRPTTNLQLSALGFNCMKDLDNKGLLRYYAVNNLINDLNNSFQSCLAAFNYDFKVCFTTDCNGSLPTNKDIFLSSYFIAGDSDFKPRLINLWVWLK